MEQLSPRERIQATLRGDRVDRPAWSLWRHFYDRESTAEELAEAMLAWRERYRFDFLKVNPRAHYHVEPWGVEYVHAGSERDRPRRVRAAVLDHSDWERIVTVDPAGGALGEQLAALRAIETRLGGDVPFVETIFSPLMVAGYLVESDEQLLQDLREHPLAVHAALQAITDTFAAFARLCLEAGAEGIFFATTWASHEVLDVDEYDEFGRYYDLQVLEAVQEGRLNILHVCGEENMLLDLADYPVHAFSWATRGRDNPTLESAQVGLPGVLIGGLSQDSLTREDPAAVEEEARAALEQSGGLGWMLGPACSIPADARDENIRAAGRAIGVEL